MKKGIKSKLAFILMVAFFISIFTLSPVYAFDKTESGIVTVENLPEFTDEEFLQTPVRMEIFVTEWCKYCKQLEASMIDAIYSKYTKEQVAIRLLDKEHPEVETYFSEYQDKFDMGQDEDRKGRIPAIIINGQYMTIGYGGEEMDTAIIEGINELLNAKELQVLKTYRLKEEYKGKTDKSVYRYKGTATNYLEQVDKNEEINNNEEKNTGVKMGDTKENQVNSSPLADNTIFFAIQGMYDSIYNPIFAYMLAILLFFISYDKKKLMAFSGLYVLGLIGANLVVRFYNTGLASFRQPILLTLSLLFAYISLSIFWDILFTTMNKNEEKYHKNNKEKIKYNRNFLLRILEKGLNSKWSYLFIFLFGFAVYLFTTPYDLDYGVILYLDERFQLVTKIIWIILNGFCASLLTILLGFIVTMAKKMSHELITPYKNYNFFYWGAVFYSILVILLIFHIFQMY